MYIELIEPREDLKQENKTCPLITILHCLLAEEIQLSQIIYLILGLSFS